MKRSIPLPPSPTTSHSSGGDNHSRWWHQSQTAALLSPPCPYAHTSLPWPPSLQSLHSSGVAFLWKWRIKRFFIFLFKKGRKNIYPTHVNANQLLYLFHCFHVKIIAALVFSWTAALLSPPCPYAHTSLPWPPSPQSLHSSGVNFYENEE